MRPLLIYSVLIFILTPPVLNAGTSRKGEDIYSARCAECHGVDAKGSAEKAEALQVDPRQLDLTRSPVNRKSSKQLYRLIARGHGKMSPHEDWLTPAQIRAVVRYLRSLQRDYVSKDVP